MTIGINWGRTRKATAPQKKSNRTEVLKLCVATPRDVMGIGEGSRVIELETKINVI